MAINWFPAAMSNRTAWIDLSDDAQHLLIRVYLFACDAHGVFPTHPAALSRLAQLGWDRGRLREAVEDVITRELAMEFDSRGTCVAILNGYDQDCPGRHFMRGKPEHLPPREIADRCGYTGEYMTGGKVRVRVSAYATGSERIGDVSDTLPERISDVADPLPERSGNVTAAGLVSVSGSGSKNTQRARAPEPPADPLPEPPADPLPEPEPPELHADPIPLDKRQTSADSAETAEREILDLPLDAIAPLQAMLDARARCLVAASHRGGLPPYMPGSPASKLPWTSQWVPEGRLVAAMIGDFNVEDFAAACEAMVKGQFNLGIASPVTFVKSFRAKAEQARSNAAVQAELGPPEGERGEQTYCDPSRHVNLSVVRAGDE